MSEDAPQHELLIDGLSTSGDGVGRLADGRVVFVARTLPGDQVRVRLVETKKRVQYAELVELLEPSADRVESRCKVVACGGCALRGLGALGQAEVKRRHVVETLRRVGKVDVSTLLGPVAQLPEGWRSRHRARFHVGFVGKRYRLGYHARRSTELVPLSSCPILWSELEQAALELDQALEELPQEVGLESVELCYSRRDGRAAAQLVARGDLAPFREWLPNTAGPRLSGLEVRTPTSSLRHGNLELRYDHQRADTFDLRFEPGVFTQATPDMNDQLQDAVLRWVRPGPSQRVLELHAGIGNFSVLLRLSGLDVTAIERHRRATILCQRNAAGAGVDLDVRPLRDDEAMSLLPDYDTVVLDPPRTGARTVAEAVQAATNVRRVAYIACDAATLARDTAILVGGGFTLTAAQAFDMFPETPHVETLLVFER